ncbi:hypothetical protein BOW53_00910 [Solemya pervernicosa gill symbiont]|uniref:histidine kinase n=2 Tax=Gammaproteobacteria incertae sedis TaxID=118884 RepID=A0A1T2LAQ9_9GAMM|nr:ABC transporter substrate-binding protein [Candidatus Reidiella endopervernicosa]OOZ42171.1 hypothetical protein BOW53_00910 [Solemya pervernicosa gill symbiont]QKQ27261.1 ABC transporter substrate-binding protein [Candidatus Reidiella endopervernicosa]
MKSIGFTARSLVALLSLLIVTPLTAADSVRLQLKWTHQFQFAGYYAAEALGYYRDANLEVEIIEGSPDINTAEVVLKGDAEYGVGSSSLLLLREAGKPLVVLGVLFQHSPYVLISRRDSALQSLHDLVNKRLMIEPLADELIAYLKIEGLDRGLADIREGEHNLESFIAGEVDAISAYVTSEPYALRQRGVDINIYSPRSAGIDFYGDNFFTTDDELLNHPDRAARFRNASLKGWRYAMDHPEEIIDLILNEYSSTRSREELVYEMESMQKLIHPELIELGYMLDGRWQHIAETYATLGMLGGEVDLDGFLYRENGGQDYQLAYRVAAVAFSVLLVTIILSLRFSSLNKKLLRLLHVKSKFANIGESVNHISHQWKQPLNDLGLQVMLLEQTLFNEPISEDSKKIVRRATAKSHDLLEFMAGTVDVFSGLMKMGGESIDFYPDSIVRKALSFVSDAFELDGIVITSSFDDGVQLNGNPAEFAHAVLVILNNARDVFIERGTDSPRIAVRSRMTANGHYRLVISDNGGGITVKPVERVFDLGVSDKKNDESGVGLYIAKKLIEEGFGGKVIASNSQDQDGALFSVTIPGHVQSV